MRLRIPDSVRCRLRSEQVLRHHIVTPGNLRYHRPRHQRLGDDFALLLVLPVAPLANPRTYLDTAPAALRVKYIANHISKTIQANQRASVSPPDPCLKVGARHRSRSDAAPGVPFASVM